MQSRRSVMKLGIASLVTLSPLRANAQDVEVETIDLTYEGMLAVSNVPTLPTAPDGECAVVMQATGPDSSAAAVIHNGTSEDIWINSVSATGINESGEEDTSVPEESIHAPLTLAAGAYGIAAVEFPERYEEYSDVVFELDLVAEAEADPGLVNMPLTELQVSDDGTGGSLNLRTQNRSQNILAKGSGFVGIFFSEEGEIHDWFVSTTLTDTEPGEDRWITHVSSSLGITDSFIIGFTGRAID